MDGQPIEHEVEGTLDEAFTGTQRSLSSDSPNGQPRTITVKTRPVSILGRACGSPVKARRAWAAASAAICFW